MNFKKNLFEIGNVSAREIAYSMLDMMEIKKEKNPQK